jgi:serine/threonine-protein kinase PknK
MPRRRRGCGAGQPEPGGSASRAQWQGSCNGCSAGRVLALQTPLRSVASAPKGPAERRVRNDPRPTVHHLDRSLRIGPPLIPPSSPNISDALPPGFSEARLLRDRDGTRVLRALRGGRPVLLRLSPATAAGEALAELEALRSLSGPSLALPTEFGLLGEGLLWSARPWIDGQTLDEWAKERQAGELLPVLGSVAAALDCLHQGGFVHGDLKPSNVLVAEDGSVWLADFGLSRRQGGHKVLPGEVAAGGTPFYAAPEVLAGGPPTPRSDLFALGMLGVRCLSPTILSPRDFYARFPSQPALEALGLSPADLPATARDLLSALLQRRPDERPESAAIVERAFKSRAGISAARAERPSVPWTLGRDGWLQDLARGLGLGPALRLACAAPSEDGVALASRLALEALLLGHGIEAVDLEASLGEHSGEAELDAFALRLAGAGHRGIVLTYRRAGPWVARAVAHLDRTFSQKAPSCHVVALGPDLSGALPPHFEPRPAPPLNRPAIAAYLATWLDESAMRSERFAERLERAARGSTAALEALLASGMQRGWFTPSERGLRLAPGPLPLVESPAEDHSDLPAAAIDLALALEAFEEPVTLARAAQLAQLTTGDAQVGRSALRAMGALLENDGRLTLIRPLVPGEPFMAQRRAIAARQATLLEATGESPHLLMIARLAAQVDGVDDAWVEHIEDLLARGDGAVAVDLLERARRRLRLQVRALPSNLEGLGALAWLKLGQPAAELSQTLERSGDPIERALSLRLRAHLALGARQSELALKHLGAARELDPQGAEAADEAEARAAYERGDHERVLALCAANATATADPRSTAALNLALLAANALFMRGEVESAKTRLEGLLRSASHFADPGIRALVSLDLAQIERRRGALERAGELLRAAVQGAESSGRLPALALALATLGSVERDRGELREAERALLRALELRERLGDETGAALARGMLGLTLAERGRPAAALVELERAVDLLPERERARFAPLLVARIHELRARIDTHTTPPPLPGPRDAPIDPREWLSTARCLALCGQREDAAALAERTRLLCRQIKLSLAEREAAALVAALAGKFQAPEPGSETQSLASEDQRLLAALARAPEPTALAELELLAARFETSGRDDRAARAHLALAARHPEATRRANARGHGEAAFERSSLGLTPAEAVLWRQSLLGIADPWPSDLEAPAGDLAPEALDMALIDLLEINRRLVEQEDLSTLLGVIVEAACQVTGAERGFLVLAERGQLALDQAVATRRGAIGEAEVSLSTSAVKEALQRGRTLRLSNAQSDPLIGDAPSVQSLDLRSILVAPFRVDQDQQGVIYVDHRLRQDAFDGQSERLLSLLADQAALAIRQVRRLAEIKSLNQRLTQRVASQQSELEHARKSLSSQGLTGPLGGLIGESGPMREVRRLIERVGPSHLTVLISGASGTGKELAARAVHEASPLREQAFVAQNMAALPASLIESELFGYRRGAFTGADGDREGLFERADGGTLFLDEIGEMPLDLQAKLLRVLELGEVRRLGDDRSRPVRFRLVAATNRDLGKEVEFGRFRDDLYYRLAGLKIELPPLSSRAEDIPALVEHFLRLEAGPDRPPRRIARPVLAALSRRAWPGNVRELRNQIARLCVLSEGDLVDPSLISLPGPVAQSSSPLPSSGPLPTLAELERQAIERALELTQGDKNKAADMLGISRAKVYQRLKEWRQPVSDGNPS